MFPLKKQGKVAKEDARVKGALEVEVITYCSCPTPPFLSTEGRGLRTRMSPPSYIITKTEVKMRST